MWVYRDSSVPRVCSATVHYFMTVSFCSLWGAHWLNSSSTLPIPSPLHQHVWAMDSSMRDRLLVAFAAMHALLLIEDMNRFSCLRQENHNVERTVKRNTSLYSRQSLYWIGRRAEMLVKDASHLSGYIGVVTEVYMVLVKRTQFVSGDRLLSLLKRTFIEDWMTVIQTWETTVVYESVHKSSLSLEGDPYTLPLLSATEPNKVNCIPFPVLLLWDKSPSAYKVWDSNCWDRKVL